jgi:hypothetical protein
MLRYVLSLSTSFRLTLPKFICAKDTAAFYACAVRDILAGEEITSDYGPNYFEVCPCTTCNPGAPRTEARPGKNEAKRSREEIEAEWEGKKKAKRARQKTKQKARRKEPTLGSGDGSHWVDGEVSGECSLGERGGDQ